MRAPGFVVAVVAVAAAACGKRGHAHDTCKRASDKYVACLAQELGPELAARAKAKEDLGACERDGETVAMYDTCLPETGCTAFLACMQRQANATAPVVPANQPRAAQCAQHVEDGLRSIANQVVATGEVEQRASAARDAAQRCVLDEAKRWADCLTADERKLVDAYGKQRQKDCEAWSPELAACIFNQPGAQHCNPDEYPLWRDPRPEGPAGPAAIWSIGGLAGTHLDSAPLAWTADHALVIGDDTGVQLVRDGKVVWTVAGKLGAATLAGRYLAGKRDGQGVRVIDLATGAQTTALADSSIQALGAAGDKLLALSGNSDVYELTPSACKGPCARKLGSFGDDLYMADTIAAWHDKLVFTNNANVRVTDRHAKIAFELTQPDDSTVELAGDELAVTEPGNVAFLSLPGCMRSGAHLELTSLADAPDGCVGVFKQDPLDGQAIAVGHSLVATDDLGTELYNDDGTGWKKPLGVTGPIVGDDKWLYATSVDADGARLLAIARATGKLAWLTVLDPRTTSGEAALALRDGMLAVRVGDRVYAIALGA